MISRLILYYPVSALVTLFANILQNPQDARARSDLKLMNSVVNFLSMLCAEESNGSVRRMLSVCSEFERIAKVALDKAEREMRGRGKRKQAEREREAAQLHEKTLEQLQVETQAAYRKPVQTPSLRASAAGSAAGGSPASWNGSNSNQDHRTPDFSNDYSNSGHTGYTPRSSNAVPFTLPNSSGQTIPPFPADFGTSQPPPRSASYSQPQLALEDGFQPNNAGFAPSNNMDGIGDFSMQGFEGLNGMDGSFNGSFQQPFVPQDLWQMPMTLEWDWAENLGAFGMGTNFENPDVGAAFGEVGQHTSGQ